MVLSLTAYNNNQLGQYATHMEYAHKIEEDGSLITRRMYSVIQRRWRVRSRRLLLHGGAVKINVRTEAPIYLCIDNTDCVVVVVIHDVEVTQLWQK